MMKIIKNENNIRCLLLLFLLSFFVFPSSLVYAKENEATMAEEKIPEQEHFLPPLIVPLEGDSTEYIDFYEDMPLQPSIPIVQTLYTASASADTLYQGSDLDSFFEHSVFVGDSLTVGFSEFCSYANDHIASESTYFLARQSCSAQAAISSKALTSFANIMPKYKNQVQLIEDSVAQMTDVEKVFICYGMNDLVSATPEKFVQNQETLINRILEKSPNVSIHVISVPCIVANTKTGGLSNESIRSANTQLTSLCTARQWGFINLSEYLMNDSLAIRSEYSSDGYVHENAAAYRIWTKVLRNYAYESMNSTF